MKELKQINILFENCEEISIPRNVIGELCIKDIKQTIQRIACNSISKYMIVEEVYLEIFKEGDSKYNPFGCMEENSKFNRLTKFNDITHLELEYNDETTECYSVSYDEGENEGILGAPNVNQDTYVSELGNVYIVISKSKKKVSDIFDIDEINNKESISFKKDMYDIGINEEKRHTLTKDSLPELYRYVYIYDNEGNSRLVVRVNDEDSGWKFIYENLSEETIIPVEWEYPTLKIDDFIRDEQKGTRFDIWEIKKKYQQAR